MRLKSLIFFLSALFCGLAAHAEDYGEEKNAATQTVWGVTYQFATHPGIKGSVNAYAILGTIAPTNATELNLPLTLSYNNCNYLMTAIDENCFSAKGSSVKKIVVPPTVTGVGRWAFRGMDNLETVVFQGPLTSIHEQAFDKCKNLKHIYFSNITCTPLLKTIAYTATQTQGLTIHLPAAINEGRAAILALDVNREFSASEKFALNFHNDLKVYPNSMDLRFALNEDLYFPYYGVAKTGSRNSEWAMPYIRILSPEKLGTPALTDEKNANDPYKLATFVGKDYVCTMDFNGQFESAPYIVFDKKSDIKVHVANTGEGTTSLHFESDISTDLPTFFGNQEYCDAWLGLYDRTYTLKAGNSMKVTANPKYPTIRPELYIDGHPANWKSWSSSSSFFDDIYNDMDIEVRHVDYVGKYTITGLLSATAQYTYHGEAITKSIAGDVTLDVDCGTEIKLTIPYNVRLSVKQDGAELRTPNTANYTVTLTAPETAGGTKKTQFYVSKKDDAETPETPTITLFLMGNGSVLFKGYCNEGESEEVVTKTVTVSNEVTEIELPWNSNDNETYENWGFDMTLIPATGEKEVAANFDGYIDILSDEYKYDQSTKTFTWRGQDEEPPGCFSIFVLFTQDNVADPLKQTIVRNGGKSQLVMCALDKAPYTIEGNYATVPLHYEDDETLCDYLYVFVDENEQFQALRNGIDVTNEFVERRYGKDPAIAYEFCGDEMRYASVWTLLFTEKPKEARNLTLMRNEGGTVSATINGDTPATLNDDTYQVAELTGNVTSLELTATPNEGKRVSILIDGADITSSLNATTHQLNIPAAELSKNPIISVVFTDVPLQGDVNSDGKVNTQDLQIIIDAAYEQ
ncbi:MAG: leucine-rich repeat protein [Prevotella sp.]|nr:leucine-rich repeat protein [Prevotella sp.]